MNLPVLCRVGCAVAFALQASVTAADDSSRLLRIDHYVRGSSTAPAIHGKTGQIYVREVVRAGMALRGATAGNVVLFVHGG
jgi:hypothetical protein